MTNALSVVSLTDKYEPDSRVLHNLESETRTAVVDYLRYTGLRPEEIGHRLGISRATVYREFVNARKVRAQDEVNFIPAREMAAELRADAEQSHALAMRNGDALAAFGIKLKLAELMAEWGLILIDKEGNTMPATLTEMRKQLEDRMTKNLLPATTESGNGQPDNGSPDSPA